MSEKNTPTSQQQRHENILQCLSWINRCGWIRAAELGAFVWPKNSTPKSPASPLIRVMLADRLVHAVDLPDRAGQALLLARRGAALLRQECQVEAAACERWAPPSSWRHDVMAVGALAWLHRRGWTVFPEASVRADMSLQDGQKMPDALVCDPEGAWWWYEQENARKTGPAMRHLAQTAAGIGLGGVEILDIRPVGMMVGYPAAARDEGGHRIDHRARVNRAIERACSGAVKLLWAACELQGAGVASCTLEGSTAHPDRAQRVLGVLDAQGWVKNGSGVLVAQHPPYQAYIWQGPYNPPWAYDAEGPGIADYTEAEVRPPVANLSEAKFAAATLIADAIATEKAARARKRL